MACENARLDDSARISNNNSANWFNLCFSACADYGSYQVGVAQFLHERYDVVQSPHILLSGCSSGALVATSLLLGAQQGPLDTALQFGQFYAAHHRFAHLDLLSLLQQFVVELLQRLYPDAEAEQVICTTLNERLFVQVTTNISKAQGTLLHGCWQSLAQFANDLASSSYIPGVTGSLFTSDCLRLKWKDGGFSDNTPRLQLDGSNSFVWAKSLANPFFHSPPAAAAELADHSGSASSSGSGCGDKVVPNIVISQYSWRTRTRVEFIEGFFVRLGKEHVMKLAEEGYKDAYQHRDEWTAIPGLVRRSEVLTHPMTVNWNDFIR